MYKPSEKPRTPNFSVFDIVFLLLQNPFYVLFVVYDGKITFIPYRLTLGTMTKKSQFTTKLNPRINLSTDKLSSYSVSISSRTTYVIL